LIDAGVVHGLTVGLLAQGYDNPKPIPKLHEDMWELACSDEERVAIAVPRAHAKSTAITHAFVLSMVLFRERAFVLIVSDTETQASEFLGDLKTELMHNEAMRETFGIRRFLKDTETNIIVQFKDGGKFRILAKGSEQKLRGLKWDGKRPDLVVGDDLENDDIVMNPERREKFRKWFMNALIPCGSDRCIYRIVGTILHLDSMLNRLLSDPTWKSMIREACDEKFENILWVEQFPKERLQKLHDSFIAQGNADGWNQEYRNRPVAEGNTYFVRDNFLDFDRDEGKAYLPNLVYYAAADFAISEKEKADYTVIMVAGMDPDGYLYVTDLRYGRWDSETIIDELISVQKAWNPQIFTFETEKIDKALGPFLERKMRETGVFLNIHLETPTKSKTARGRSIQAMVKSRSVRFDHQASWFDDFKSQMLTISSSGPRGAHDDMFDAFAYIGLTVNQYYEAQSPKEIEEEEYEDAFQSDMGRCAVTGY